MKPRSEGEDPVLTVAALEQVSLQVVRRHPLVVDPPYFADLTVPAHIASLAREHLFSDDADRAVFFLDGSQRLLAYSVLEPSTPRAARDALRTAIVHCARSLVVCSLRRSGGIVPQVDDYALTRQMFQAGAVLGIPLYDHTIVAADEYCSFRELGWLDPSVAVDGWGLDT